MKFKNGSGNGNGHVNDNSNSNSKIRTREIVTFEQEVRVIGLISKGLTQMEIAQKLGVDQSTIKLIPY